MGAERGSIPSIRTARSRWSDLAVPAGLGLALGLLLWVVWLCLGGRGTA